MSRALSLAVASSMRFPRVSGDEPGRELTCTDGDEFSPRERG